PYTTLFRSRSRSSDRSRRPAQLCVLAGPAVLLDEEPAGLPLGRARLRERARPRRPARRGVQTRPLLQLPAAAADPSVGDLVEPCGDGGEHAPPGLAGVHRGAV